MIKIAVYRKSSFAYHLLVAILFFLGNKFTANAQQTALSQKGIAIIPYPKQVTFIGSNFILDNNIAIVVDKKATKNDQFAADELSKYMLQVLGVRSKIVQKSSGKAIYLTRTGADKK